MKKQLLGLITAFSKHYAKGENMKRYKFEVVGTVEVIGEDEHDARNVAMEVISGEPQEYVGDLLKETELPQCKMSSECNLWHRYWATFSEEAKKTNPAGCRYYEDGFCTV